MLVRPARREDAAAIADVHVLTWQAAYEHVFGAERLAEIGEGRRAVWEARLANPEPGRELFVSEDDDGRVTGFVSVGEVANPARASCSRSTSCPKRGAPARARL